MAVSFQDVIAIARAIQSQVETHQSNNALSVEIKNRCITISSILSKDCDGGITPAASAVLSQLRYVLTECQDLLAKFANSATFVNFIFAKTYTQQFTDLHGRLLRQITDLQLVWAKDANDRIAEMEAMLAHSNEIARATLAKFEHEAFEILSGIQHLDELLNLNRTEQAQLLGNLKGFVVESIAKVLDELAQLKDQKDRGQAYRRNAANKLQKALEADVNEKINPSFVDVNWQRLLGEGSFGRVFAAQLMGVGDVAVKLIPRDIASNDFLREVAALQRVVASREVLRLHGWTEIVDPKTDQRFIVAVTDLCVRSLTKAIHDGSYEPPFVIWVDYLMQIATGMAFLAAKGMYHRDLKPDNVLIAMDGHAVISDFGLAVTKSTVMRSTANRPDLVGGTPGFMAPEAMVGKVSEASDVYSFGVLAAYVLFRSFPWVDDRGHPLTGKQIEVLSRSNPPTKMPSADMFPELTRTVVSLLNDSCSIEPAFRPYFVQLQFALFDSRKILVHGSSASGVPKSVASISPNPVHATEGPKGDTADPSSIEGKVSPSFTTVTKPDTFSSSFSADSGSPKPTSNLQATFEQVPSKGLTNKEGEKKENELTRIIRELCADHGYDDTEYTELDSILNNKRTALAKATTDKRVKAVEKLSAEVQALEQLVQEVNAATAQYDRHQKQLKILFDDSGFDEVQSYDDLVACIGLKKQEIESLEQQDGGNVRNKQRKLDKLKIDLRALEDLKRDADDLLRPPQDNKRNAVATVRGNTNAETMKDSASIRNAESTTATTTTTAATAATAIAANEPSVAAPKKTSVGTNLSNKTGSSSGESIYDASHITAIASETGIVWNMSLLPSPSSSTVTAAADNTCTHFVTAGWKVRIWDSSTGAKVKQITSPETVYSVLAVSADLVLAGQDNGDIIKIDVNADSVVATFKGHSAGVVSLALMTHGRIASGCHDKTVKIWRISDGTCLSTLEKHEKQVNCIIAPMIQGQERIVSASSDYTLIIWDPESHRCLHTLSGHTSWVRCVVALLNNQLASGADDKSIRIWDAIAGSCLHIFSQAHKDYVRGLAYSAKFPNRLVSGSKDRTVKVWEISSAREVQCLEGHTDEVESVLILPNGSIISGADDKTFCIWPLTGASPPLPASPPAAASAPAPIAPTKPATSPAKAAPSSPSTLTTQEMQIVNMYATANITSIPSENGIPYKLCLLPDGRIFSAGWYARIFSADGELLQCIRCAAGSLYSLALVDGNTMMAGLFKGFIVKLALQEEKIVSSWKAHEKDISGVAVLSQDRIVSCCEDGSMKAWRISDGQLLASWAIPDRMNCIVALTSEKVAAGTSNAANYLILWDPATNVIENIPGNSGGVWGITAFNGDRLVTGGNDHRVRMWDATNRVLLRTFDGHVSCVNCVTTFSDNQFIISGGDDKTLKIWSVQTGALLLSQDGKGGEVKSIVVSDTRRIIYSSLDRSIAIWRPAF